MRDEANGWIVWGAVFGVAQSELEVRYADLRKCARWKPTPLSGLGTGPVVDFGREDERAVALRLRNALWRSIETLERVPKVRPSLVTRTTLSLTLFVIFSPGPRSLSISRRGRIHPFF